ncbi:MAG TPA: thiamine phosphate synthase [Xanthobacteraceae bacterium]|nr:thiamine phosphate synthase [Xanthobacteraceae bacterium]
MRLPGPLLVITDRRQARHSIEAIAEAVGQGGGRWLLLRDKDLEPAVRRSLAARLAEIARRHGMHLSVSRDVDLAAEFGASVHLQSAAAVAGARQRLGPGALIGVSAHGLGDVAAAAAAGADYVTLSPIFLTPSKPGYGPALGVEAIASAAKSGISVVALGGITANVVDPCLEAGAHGIAVMGEIMRSDDPGSAACRLLAACKAATPAPDSTSRLPTGLAGAR